MKKGSFGEWYQKNKDALSIAAVLLVVALLFFIWFLSVMSALLPICWHYFLCTPLFILCCFLKKNGKKKMAAGLVFVIFAVAIAGFFLVYQGPFVESGKTFHEYVTKYAVYTMPILLFPCMATLIALKK